MYRRDARFVRGKLKRVCVRGCVAVTWCAQAKHVLEPFGCDAAFLRMNDEGSDEGGAFSRLTMSAGGDECAKR